MTVQFYPKALILFAVGRRAARTRAARHTRPCEGVTPPGAIRPVMIGSFS
jgi:hypothetical protein